MQRVGLANLSNDLRAAACEALLALGDRLSPVVVAGRVGVGKSTLAAVVARSFPTWGWYGLDDLLTTLMTCRTEGSVQRWDSQGYAQHTTEQQLLRKVEMVSILVLDDVGTRTLSQPQAEALRAILDARVGKPLLATTNCTTRELDESIGVRNRSRLLAGAGQNAPSWATPPPPRHPPPKGCPQPPRSEHRITPKIGGSLPPPTGPRGSHGSRLFCFPRFFEVAYYYHGQNSSQNRRETHEERGCRVRGRGAA